MNVVYVGLEAQRNKVEETRDLGGVISMVVDSNNDATDLWFFDFAGWRFMVRRRDFCFYFL